MADIIRWAYIYFMSWFRSRRFEVDQQCRVLYIRYDLVYYADTSRESTYLIIHAGVNPCLIILQTLLSLIISACNLSLSLFLYRWYCFLSSSPNETAGYMTSLHSYVNIWNSDGFDRTCEHFHWTIYRTYLFRSYYYLFVYSHWFSNLLFNPFYRIKKIYLCADWLKISLKIFLQDEIFKFHWNDCWLERVALFFNFNKIGKIISCISYSKFKSTD